MKATGKRPYYTPDTGFSPAKSRSHKICATCGKPKGGRGANCRECYQRFRQEPVVLVCGFCGKSFERSRGEAEKKERRGHTDVYCSLACATAHHAVAFRRRCRRCGKPTPARTQGYCSDECRAAARAERAIWATCPECETYFRAKTNRTVYCSRVCADLAHSRRMRGAGNSHFRTGTSYAKWFRESRPLILERDGGCVICGATETIIICERGGVPHERSTLVIHHINEDPTDNSVENLVTLCMTCHAVHHKSSETPFPQLGEYAVRASASMTSKWRERATSLQTAYSSTTA